MADFLNSETKIYKLKTVTYGATSAPFMAIRTCHQLASDEDHDVPKVTIILRRYFYVNAVIMEGLEIPRFMMARYTREMQFHGFCNASELAYSACEFLRLTDESGTMHTYLVCSKYRVVPLNKAGRQTSTRSRKGCLHPFPDELELLRVGRKIQKLLLDYEKKFSALPKNIEVAILIASNEHARHPHAGPQHLLAAIPMAVHTAARVTFLVSLVQGVPESSSEPDQVDHRNLEPGSWKVGYHQRRSSPSTKGIMRRVVELHTGEDGRPFKVGGTLVLVGTRPQTGAPAHVHFPEERVPNGSPLFPLRRLWRQHLKECGKGEVQVVARENDQGPGSVRR
ncbi:hypothetical protein PR048_016204 [Dryococelus australis]|uniref:Uncharacterized protein n=1 Tax=Dryococelus australis TaxID=614101 RepID=A0ABQ9HJD4_9NEOP|nr:hypothetical protein PR048_016204 [Dryococelus australis]